MLVSKAPVPAPVATNIEVATIPLHEQYCFTILVTSQHDALVYPLVRIT